MSNQIKLRNFSFPSSGTVLSNASFSASSGDIIIVSGPSGIGKSTLLNTLGLLSETQNIDYQFFNHAVNQLDEKVKAAIRNQLIGFIFQSHHLIEDLSVIDNVLLPTQYATQCPSYREKGHELLDLFLIKQHDEPAYLLSYGQQQRVAIARALLLSPKVILADEPTSGLDQLHSEIVFNYFKQAACEGSIVIISTHDPFILQQSAKHYAIKDKQIYTKN